MESAQKLTPKKISVAFKEVHAFFNEDLNGLIKEQMTESREKKPLTSKDYIRISGLPYLCPREEAYCKLENHMRVDKVEHKLMLIFETGNAFQDIVRDKAIAKNGLLVGMWRCKNCDYVHGSTDGEFTLNYQKVKEAKLKARISSPSVCGINIERYGVCESEEFEYIEETLVDETLRLTGHPDGFLSSRLYDSVLEIKTANDNRFSQAKKKPFQDHLEQAMLYAKMTGKKRITLLYFNKNNGDYCIYDLDVDEVLVARVRSRVKQTWDVIKEIEDTGKVKELPGRVCTSPREYRAKGCEMCTKCFSSDL